MTIPVRHIETRASAPDGYTAMVRITGDGSVLADWHLPLFASSRWHSPAEAQRDALDYATGVIDRNVL